MKKIRTISAMTLISAAIFACTEKQGGSDRNAPPNIETPNTENVIDEKNGQLPSNMELCSKLVEDKVLTDSSSGESGFEVKISISEQDKIVSEVVCKGMKINK